MEESGKISAPATFFSDLAAGTAHLFGDWPNPGVPTLLPGFIQSGIVMAASFMLACRVVA
ncbi:MAG TPA: hypothetical protein VN939_09180 [Chthoniobacterales bacterium]|nr:hypothetical protein [Chthoniobacterales bacterium]